MLGPKNFGPKKIFAQKNFAFKKIWSKIMLVQNILGKTILRSKKIHKYFGCKQILGSKILD